MCCTIHRHNADQYAHLIKTITATATVTATATATKFKINKKTKTAKIPKTSLVKAGKAVLHTSRFSSAARNL